MNGLNQLNDALEFLAARNCRRDSSAGQWLSPEGVALGSDPVSAAKAFRRLAIGREIEKNRVEGWNFVR